MELRMAARRLLSDPWAAGAAIMAAALGAGLNTAVFAVAYGVLLRPLPYADAERLAIVEADTSRRQVEEWRRRLPSFEHLTGYGRDRLTVRGAGEPRLAGVALVDEQFFTTLGARAEAGTPFRTGGPAAVAVVSDRFARQGGEPVERILGRTLTVGVAPVTVVAVMPAAFAFPSENIDVWMPAEAVPAIAFDRTSDARRFQLVGRLTPGASLAQDAARRQPSRPVDARRRRRVRQRRHRRRLLRARPPLRGGRPARTAAR